MDYSQYHWDFAVIISTVDNIIFLLVLVGMLFVITKHYREHGVRMNLPLALSYLGGSVLIFAMLIDIIISWSIYFGLIG